MTIKQYARAAQRHFPHSKHLRREWIAKTMFLMASGKHALLTGGFKPVGIQ
ncbi:MAG: hypothetical protein PHW66_06280 [Gallionella sp.]|nr:hypothetical protein [Gallionella sp.]